jgi:hypothetical protein
LQLCSGTVVRLVSNTGRTDDRQQPVLEQHVNQLGSSPPLAARPLTDPCSDKDKGNAGRSRTYPGRLLCRSISDSAAVYPRLPSIWNYKRKRGKIKSVRVREKDEGRKRRTEKQY